MRIQMAAVVACTSAVMLSGCFLPSNYTPPRAPASDPVEVETTAPGAEDAPEPEGPTLTMGQQQAVAKAESYLRYSAFSRSGLIDQLEFEGFSTEEATFAVDYITVDWNAQAVAKAESYLSFSSFSRQGLIDQLLFEGFAQAEAEFAVAAVGY